MCLSFHQLVHCDLKNTIKPSALANLLYCSGVLFFLYLTSYLFPHLLIFVLCYSISITIRYLKFSGIMRE